MTETPHDLEALIEAFTSSLDAIAQYYDRGSGEIVSLSEEFGTGELEGPPDRYVVITPLSVNDRYQIMEDFVENVGDESLEEELNEALIEKGAFLRFEGVLAKYPARLQQWRAFRTGKVTAHVRAWLSEHGLDTD